MSGPRSSGTDELAVLERVQRKVLWLSTWMVHHANARPSADGTKVGGHQASSASVVSLLTALYFKTLESDDLVAVKAHAAPAFYACQYLRGRLPKEALTGLRRLGRVLGLVDVNRQALDRIIPEARTRQLGRMFAACGWRVSELRWGRRLRALFGAPGGERLRQRLDAMSNAEYQRLLRQPAGAVRKALVGAGDGGTDAEIDRTLGALGDVELQAIVTAVGGHDLALILAALAQAGHEPRHAPRSRAHPPTA